MRLTITIDLDSAAFEDGGTEEVARVLADIPGRLLEPLAPTLGRYSLHDVNGNWCGEFEVTP